MKKGWLAVMVALTLIFSLVCAVASAEGATAYPDSIGVGLLDLKNGQYYTGSGSPTTTKPTGDTGYIFYQNGVLELNNIALINQTIGTNASGALTINLVGKNSISCTNADSICLNLYNTDCTLTGTGSLTVTTESANAINNAINVNSLTVDGNITLSATSHQDYCVIWAKNNILLNSGTITAKATGGTASVASRPNGTALFSESGNITIGGAKVTAEGKKAALYCEKGTFSMTSGILNAECGWGWAVKAKDIQMTGGTAKIEPDPDTGCSGLYATHDVEISEKANVTVNSDDSSIAAGGSLTISGGTVSVNSAHYVAIHSDGILQISGGKVTVTGKNYALFGRTGVEIKGGIVEANSTEGEGIFSAGTLKVSGGTVTVDSCLDALYGGEGVEINGGTVEATSTEGGGIRSNGTLKVSDGKVTANAGYNALYGYTGVEITGGTVEANATESFGIYSDGTIKVSDGKVTANACYSALSAWDGVEISGGTVEANATESFGIYSNGTIKVSDGTVTVKSCWDALSGGEGVEITGGTVQATSTEGIGISFPTIKVSDGTVTVKSCWDALSGWNGVEITGGTVNATATEGNALASMGEIRLSGGSTTAISQQDTAVYCADGTLSVTGGTLAASGKPAITAGKSILNGDVMVCVNDSFSPTNGVKGVVYEYVNIRLDEEGNTILRGGEGTKYGNPQFEDFESIKPFGAVFRTSLKPPKTGDDSRIALWAAMMVLSAAGMITALRARKRTVK